MNNDKKRIGVLVFFTIICIVIRFLFFTYTSGDYEVFLKSWMQYLVNNGGFLALKFSFANYNLPYLTIMALLSYIPISSLYTIKFVSITFDVLIAILAYRMVMKFYPSEERKKYATYIYMVLLLLPTVILNSAAWGQCDSIYTFFALLSIYFLLDEKYAKAFITLGVSFAFKLQFIFLLPLFVILFFCVKKVSIKNFIYIPLVNFILCLPATIIGASPIYTYQVYFGQAMLYDRALNVFNIYNYLPKGKIVNILGVVITLGMFLALLIACYKAKFKWDNKRIITLGLLSILMCFYFLPCMHERYLYMADILSVIWYFFHNKKIHIPIIINLCSLLTYLYYFFPIPHFEICFYIFPIFLLIVIVELIVLMFEKKEKLELKK